MQQKDISYQDIFDGIVDAIQNELNGPFQGLVKASFFKLEDNKIFNYSTKNDRLYDKPNIPNHFGIFHVRRRRLVGENIGKGVNKDKVYALKDYLRISIRVCSEGENNTKLFNLSQGVIENYFSKIGPNFVVVPG